MAHSSGALLLLLLAGLCFWALRQAGWLLTSSMFASVAAATGALGVVVNWKRDWREWHWEAAVVAGVCLAAAATWQLPELAAGEYASRLDQAGFWRKDVRSASHTDAVHSALAELARIKEEARRTTLTAIAGVIAFMSWFTAWSLKRSELEHQREAAKSHDISRALELLKTSDKSAQQIAMANLRLAATSSYRPLREAALEQLRAICSGKLPATAHAQSAAAEALAATASAAEPVHIAKLVLTEGDRTDLHLRNVHVEQLSFAGGTFGNVWLRDSQIDTVVVEAEVTFLFMSHVEIGHALAIRAPVEKISVENSFVEGLTAHLPEGDVRFSQCFVSGTIGYSDRRSHEPDLDVRVEECGVALKIAGGDLDWIHLRNVHGEVKRIFATPHLEWPETWTFTSRPQTEARQSFRHLRRG